MNHHWMPHGHCFAWDPTVLALRIYGDTVIALAYFSIPAWLVMFLRWRPELAFLRKAFWAFAIFIVCCGLTHVFDIVTIWYPIYYADAIMRVITAVVSIATGIGLWRARFFVRMP